MGPEEGEKGPATALADAVREVEAHASRAGWDQPAQLFALVETADLVEREPHLADVLGVESPADGLTPVEQETTSESLEELLASILWPPEVAGCAVVVEALTVPPDAAAQVPSDPEAAAEYAAAHPDRQEARIVAGALRSGESFCAIRQRAHDDDDMVLAGPDLVPVLLELLQTTLQPDPGEPETDE